MKKLLKAVSGICVVMSMGQAYGQSEASSSSVAKANKRLERLAFDWSLVLGAESFTSEKRDLKIGGTRLRTKLGYLLNDNMKLAIEPHFVMATGSVQSIEAADKTENKISLRKATLALRPIRPVIVSAGVLNLSQTQSLLAVDTSFMGAQAELSLIKSAEQSLRLVPLYAIPSNSTLATQTEELEKNPGYEALLLNYKYNCTQGSSCLSLSAGTFRYTNLPRAVAAKAALGGNTVRTLTDNRSEFIYEYRGLQAALQANADLFWILGTEIEADYVENSEAPSSLNKAYTVGGALTFALPDDQKLSLWGRSFRVEPDATVAYFLSPTSTFGTNRIGYKSEVKYDFNKEGFSIAAQYAESELIYINSAQSREKFVGLKLETHYENR